MQGDVCAEKVDVTHDHKYGEVQPVVVHVRLGWYQEREEEGQDLVFEAVESVKVKGVVQCHHGPVAYEMNDKDKHDLHDYDTVYSPYTQFSLA